MPPTAPSAPTLATCPLRARHRVDAVSTEHATRRRLAELGIRPGARVVAVARTAGGGRVVAVSESRIAVDRRTAERIAVSPEPAAGEAGAEPHHGDDPTKERR